MANGRIGVFGHSRVEGNREQDGGQQNNAENPGGDPRNTDVDAGWSIEHQTQSGHTFNRHGKSDNPCGSRLMFNRHGGRAIDTH